VESDSCIVLSLNELYLITVLSDLYKRMNILHFQVNILISVQYTGISVLKMCKIRRQFKNSIGY
jgi:hypothetical protein